MELRTRQHGGTESRGGATAYDGPVTSTPVIIGGLSIPLTKPADPDRMLDDPEVLAWNQADDYMPYWAYLWPGAFLLAEAVAAEDWKPGTAALEIGCGLGLAGLAGLRRGLRVTFSDYDGGTFGFVEESARANGFGPEDYSLRRLDWREPPEERFPVILGADVLYERRLVPLVVNVLTAMLETGGLALIAGPYRIASEEFPTLAAKAGLSCENVPISAETTLLGGVRGTLHRVTR